MKKRIISPLQKFEPIIIHYAEAVFIPACVGQYVIKPICQDQEELAVLECYMDMGDAYH